MRAFVAAADLGQFQEAAAELAISQQAVSKRVAALEKDLGARLFTRTARGAELTVDGQAFLPHARNLLQAEARAAAAVRPGRRALRVDVRGRRIAPAGLLNGFHRAHPDIELDVVTLPDAAASIAAVHAGSIDAALCALTVPARQLPDGVTAALVFCEALQILTGPGHEFASAEAVTPAQLAGRKIWMPSIVPGTEWAAYYRELAAAFNLTIDATGPNLGIEHFLDRIAGSPELATFVGEQTYLLWHPHHDLRRIPLRDPAPVYPHSLIWRAGNPHPALATLRRYLTRQQPDPHGASRWAPRWPGTAGDTPAALSTGI